MSDRIYPALSLPDAGLMKVLEELLSTVAEGNPYKHDGAFAASLQPLPDGLRAMAATHWLDISLVKDSIVWHFANFGEPNLIRETSTGLRTLGLDGLAEVFDDAWAFTQPLLGSLAEDQDFEDYLDVLEAREPALAEALRAQYGELNDRAWELSNLDGESTIYASWIRFTRAHPERVFPLA